ncbi:MAG TPA: phosphoglycerate mutase family protein [Cyclobacteriaceae bacterium]|nr:phosphoglycerate mutase family protein [Cyclobacteriaceae bacterium]
MKKFLYVLVFLCGSAYAQSEVTTFILVRHAEKETAAAGDKDPMLSKEGQDRAQQLLQKLEKQKIDAVYSTNYNRTKNTVKPVAEAKNVTIQTYESLKFDELVAKYKGGTVLICGHSNTIPGFANSLLGNKQFANYDDSDYGNLLIVTVTAVGKGNVTHLRY